MNWAQTVERYIAEGRTVSGGKGDQSASNVETSQAGFTKTLQGIFANNNSKQQDQLNFLNGKLQSAINNPQGYSPQTLAAMRTQATEQAASENKNVEQAVNSKFATQTGATSLPSGVQEQIQAAVASQAAEAEGKAQLGITADNGKLQNENQQNAIREEMGVAGLENPEGFASEENQSAGTVGNLSQAVTSANGPGIGSILGGVVGAGLGAAGSYFGAKKGN